MSYDVIVVGGSFAGLSAALQLARARKRVLVLDSGKPRNRFAQFSHGFFGHDGQPPSAMLANARLQLLSYGTVSFAEGLATHAAKSGEEYTVTAAGGTPGSAWTTGASLPSMQSSSAPALAWPARSLNSLVANLKKARLALLSARGRISRRPYRGSTLRAMPPVRG